MKDSFGELTQLVNKVNEIFNEDIDGWSCKYDKIFNEKLSGRIRELMPFDYYDPDMDYQDDVEAYVKALNETYKKCCI